MARIFTDPKTGVTTTEGPPSLFDPSKGYTGSQSDQQLLSAYEQRLNSPDYLTKGLQGIGVFGDGVASGTSTPPPPSSQQPTTGNAPTIDSLTQLTEQLNQNAQTGPTQPSSGRTKQTASKLPAYLQRYADSQNAAFPGSVPSFDLNTSPASPTLPGVTMPTIPGLPASPFSGTATGQPYQAGAPANLSDITALVNALNLAGQQQANAARIPGAAGLEATSSANIGSQLAGQLPPDVMALINQQGAERGIATGAPGSANANAATLRALGLTSLGQQQQGQQNLSAAYARNPAAPLFDPTSQIMTPAQAAALNLQNQRNQLDFLKAFAPQGATGGGGGGRQSQPQTVADTTPSWFPRAAGVSPVNPPPAATPISSPDVAAPVFNTDIAGTGYNPTTNTSVLDPFSMFNPFGFTGGAQVGTGDVIGPNPPPGLIFGGGNYNPFSGYGEQPLDTYTTDTSSTYDPFMQYSNGAYSGG